MKKTKYSITGIVVKTGLMAVLVGLGCAMPQQASAIGAGDADTMFNGFNSAFLVNGNYYKRSINDPTFDENWTGALDIMLAEDAYERTGSAAHKALVNTLCNTFLQKFPPPYSWDGYNDDMGWVAAMLARGYLITNNANLLTQARYCFDMAWSRGWDTQYNNGGIWEQQPDMTPAGQKISKEALSNDSLGKAAALIYQGNHDQWYLDRATQIYAWVRSHIYNTSTGQVYTGIDRNNYVDTGAAVYNQGTFVDYANYLYQITGNAMYYNDAQRTINYVRNNMTSGGLMYGGGTNTWSDEFARGLGHFVRDNGQWGTYYGWMVQNANAIMSRRRTDYNICWGNFTQQTPNDNSMIVNRFADAAAWLQYTPATQPGNIGGSHTIGSKLNGIRIDNAGSVANGAGIVLWGSGASQNQKWLFTQNSDTSWNIISQSSWKALDSPNANNNTQLVQWTPTRDDNQRWWVDVQSDGSYKIWNKQNSQSLDSASTSTNGNPLVQWGWGGGTQQRWTLQ